MIKVYPYLNDSNISRRDKFYTELDKILNRKCKVKITLLDWEENPIREIEGEISSGSLSNSSGTMVQRTGSLACSVDCFTYDAESIQADYSIQKKVSIEVGVENETSYWEEYPVLWFPLGVYIISSFSLSAQANSPISLSIGLQDKMALLDGTVGGTFPVTTRIDETDDQMNSGKLLSTKVPVYTIIQELVNHYGNIPLEQIIIEDITVDTARGEKSKRILQWNGDEKLYLYKMNDDDSWNMVSETDANSSLFNLTFDPNSNVVTYKAGKDGEKKGIYKLYETDDYIGYEYTDLVYDKELNANSGDSVSSVLSTIASYLGNYEFFFDVYGNFRFREIKNYRYTDPPIVEDMDEDDYLGSYLNSGSIHRFADDLNITDFSLVPQYSNIKNDFYVIGETTAENPMQVMYHVAIDDKPIINKSGYKNLLIYKEPLGSMITCGFPEMVDGYTDGDGNYSYEDNDNVQEQITSHNNGDSYIATTETFSFSAATYKNEKIILSDKTSEVNLPVYGLQNRIYGILDYPTKYQFNNTIDDISVLTTQWSNVVAEYAKIDAGQEPTNIFNETLCAMLETRFNEYLVANDETDAAKVIAHEIVTKMSEYMSQVNTSNLQKYNSLLEYDIRSVGVVCESEAAAEQEYNRLLKILNGLSILSSVYQTVYNNYIANKLTIYAEDIQSYINNYLSVKISYYTELKDYAAGYLTLKNVKGYNSYFTKTSTYTVYEPHFYYWNNEWVELEWYRYINDIPYDYIDFTQPLLDLYGNQNPRMSICGDDSNYSIYAKYAKENNLTYCDKDADHYKQYMANDWRTELLLRGLYNEKIGTDTGWYYSELKAWWPFTYDILNNCFPWQYDALNKGIYRTSKGIGISHAKVVNHTLVLDESGFEVSETILKNTNDTESKTSISDSYYFLDFIESSSPTLGKYNVNSIGRRTYVDNSSDINCLFTPTAPDFIFYNVSNVAQYYLDDSEVQEKIDAIKEAAGSTPVLQLPDRYFDKIVTGTTRNGAYDNILYDINLYTTYQNQVNLSALPAYYLAANDRITIENKLTNTYGDYMVNSISFDFNNYASCSITASQAIDRV